MRQASETNVPDTTSGFRAYNREAALQLAVVSKFTYTLESIIQAGKLLVAIDDVTIGTNPKTRESRLFPSMWSYVRRNSLSIFRIYAQYEPMRVFFALALLLVGLAMIPWLRWAVAWVQDDGAGHVQSLIFGAVLFNAAVVMAALGVIGDLLHGQRMMTPARLRERAPDRAAARRAAVALRARRAADRPCRDDRRTQRPTPEEQRQSTAGAGGDQAVSTTSPSTTRARSPATRTTSTAPPTRSSAG